MMAIDTDLGEISVQGVYGRNNPAGTDGHIPGSVITPF